MKNNKGFTLIELLVVIAIIGILASIVLVSLGTARNKGINAAVQGELSSARAQAELYYDSNSNSYSGVCDAWTGTGPETIQKIILDATKKATGGTNIVAMGYPSANPGQSACHVGNSGGSWAASVPLKSPDNGYFCVDSTGVAYKTQNPLGSTDYVCTP